MKRLLLASCLLFVGCATSTPRVTLRDLKEYDNAIQLAEKNNIDTTAMHKKLVEMVVSYTQNPGEDAYTEAVRKQAEASEMAGLGILLNSMPTFQPQYQPMPVPPPLMPGYSYGR